MPDLPAVTLDGIPERFADLPITTGRTPKGIFIAYTQQEPLFYHQAATEAELAAQVRATLESYVKHFGGVRRP